MSTIHVKKYHNVAIIIIVYQQYCESHVVAVVSYLDGTANSSSHICVRTCVRQISGVSKSRSVVGSLT